MKILLIVVIAFYPALAMAGGDDFISYLCTDGVEQSATGFKVLRNGHVFRLLKHKDTQNPIQIPVGVNLDSATKIFTLAETNGFLDANYDHGKCTTTYHSSNKEHVVQSGGKGPKSISALFKELQTLHRSVVEKNRNKGDLTTVSPGTKHE